MTEHEVCMLYGEAYWAAGEEFDSVGGFDPRFGVTEDFEWFTRDKDAGIPVAILSEVLLLRHIHEVNISFARFEERAAKQLLISKESIKTAKEREVER